MLCVTGMASHSTPAERAWWGQFYNVSAHGQLRFAWLGGLFHLASSPPGRCLTMKLPSMRQFSNAWSPQSNYIRGQINPQSGKLCWIVDQGAAEVPSQHPASQPVSQPARHTGMQADSHPASQAARDAGRQAKTVRFKNSERMMYIALDKSIVFYEQ